MKEFVLFVLIIILGVLTFNVVTASEITPQIKKPQPAVVILDKDGSQRKVVLTCEGINHVEEQARVIAEFHNTILEKCGPPSSDGRCVAEYILKNVTSQAYLEIYTWLMVNQCHSEA